jgi:hypothetical protein
MSEPELLGDVLARLDVSSDNPFVELFVRDEHEALERWRTLYPELRRERS